MKINCLLRSVDVLYESSLFENFFVLFYISLMLMREFMKMKYLIKLAVAFFTAVVFLNACGDDSSSNGYSYAESCRLVVDEVNSTITLYEDNGYDLCIHENGMFAWKKNVHVIRERDIVSYRYFFVQDTLVLMLNGESEDNVGLVFTGGKRGSIYGAWFIRNCVYHDNQIECSDFSLYEDDVVYEFSMNSLTVKSNLENVYDRISSRFLMNSDYMYNLIKCLGSSNSCYMYIPDIFDEDEESVENIIQKMNVQKLSWERKNASFILNGQIFDVKVNDAHYDISGGDVSETISVTVSSNGKTCDNVSFVTSDIKPYCSVENEKYLVLNTIEGVNVDTIEYVSKYKKNNIDEFETCLRSLVDNSANQTYASYLTKKSNDAEIRRKYRRARRQFLEAVLEANR